jgi:uncharacterized protein (TIGR02594 family)
MLELSMFCRPLAALVVSSAAIATFASPAAARSHYGASRHHQGLQRSAHAGYSARGHYAEPGYSARSYSPEGIAYPQVMAYSQVPSYPRLSPRQRAYHPRITQVYRARMSRHVALSRLRHHAHAHASVTPYEPGGGMAMTGGSSSLVMEARHYLGTNPTGRRSLWCARFMNMVLARTGHRGTGSDMANSFAHYGHRISGPQVGAIAVMGRRSGGHVGIITGINAAGKLTMISGNNGNRVREAPVSRGRIYAYVMPN